MEPEFDVERFEKKLLNLKDTQDSITGLSKWCLNKRTAHKQIVRSWLNVLKQGKFFQLDVVVVPTRLQLAFRSIFSENRESLDAVLSRQRCYPTQQEEKLRVRR